MRKIAVIIVSVCLLLCGCTTSEPPKTTNQNTELLKGIWITYNELSSFSSSSQGFVLAFEEAVVKAKNIGINTFFVHTRAFCDAVYNSELFPFANYITSDSDALKSMIDICHQNDIEFHAWINPYRVSTASNDVNTLTDTSPAKQWLTDDNVENDKNI
ncbi:MAG: family 10 glycosylhydrolase, partial [Clostridia bacterium]|nr:family 10 glycosylhydrolase [Clostridia bacterium]